MTEEHQPDLLPLDQIKQFDRTGACRFGVRVAAVVRLVTGKALGEGTASIVNTIAPVLGSRSSTD
jgi:hypothetical protein